MTERPPSAGVDVDVDVYVDVDDQTETAVREGRRRLVATRQLADTNTEADAFVSNRPTRHITSLVCLLCPQQ